MPYSSIFLKTTLLKDLLCLWRKLSKGIVVHLMGDDCVDAQFCDKATSQPCDSLSAVSHLIPLGLALQGGSFTWSFIRAVLWRWLSTTCTSWKDNTIKIKIDVILLRQQATRYTFCQSHLKTFYAAINVQETVFPQLSVSLQNALE